MIKAGLFFCLVLIIELPAFAQSSKPVVAPSGVLLTFATQGNQHQFHLGELIPITYSYSAPGGKYFLVSLSNKLEGGHPFAVSCSPPTVQSNTPLEFESLQLDKMLNSCAGVGGGVGGGVGQDVSTATRKTS